MKQEIFYIVLLFFVSCENIPKEVQSSLELAGSNRRELEKVINHYQEPKDSLKLRAAYYLIGNMRNKYSLAGEKLDSYNTVFAAIDEISKKRNFTIDPNSGYKFLEVDSIWTEISEKEGPLNRWHLEVRPDLYYITSDF